MNSLPILCGGDTAGCFTQPAVPLVVHLLEELSYIFLVHFGICPEGIRQIVSNIFVDIILCNGRNRNNRVPGNILAFEKLQPYFKTFCKEIGGH